MCRDSILFQDDTRIIGTLVRQEWGSISPAKFRHEIGTMSRTDHTGLSHTWLKTPADTQTKNQTTNSQPAVTAMKFRDDEQILNYHDAVVYGSDLRIVQSESAWLNDACIYFYMNVLQYQDPNNNRFVDPSVISFFMHQCTDRDDIEDFQKGFQLPDDGKLFIPVNDNMKLGANWMIPNSGNHWSLLVIVFSKASAAAAWHFDSMRSSDNINAAGDIVNKLALAFPSVFKINKSNLIQAKVPQQTNCNDCGVHTLVTAMLLGSSLVVNNKTATTDLASYEERIQDFAKSNPSFCKEMRARIANEMIQKASMKWEHTQVSGELVCVCRRYHHSIIVTIVIMSTSFASEFLQPGCPCYQDYVCTFVENRLQVQHFSSTFLMFRQQHSYYFDI